MSEPVSLPITLPITLADRIYRLVFNAFTADDLKFNAYIYKAQVTQFIIENAIKKELYCVICYGNSKQNQLCPELHLPIQRNVMTFIIQWLQDEEKLRVIDQEEDSCILIGLR